MISTDSLTGHSDPAPSINPVGQGILPASPSTTFVEGINIVNQNTESVSRPGVSAVTLARAGIRRVDSATAYQRVGYSAPGIVIPYYNLDGSPLTVNEKPFYRLRLDNPQGSAKYLSPSDSGCQLYIPPGLENLLRQGQLLFIVEGEFKALALVEAGIAAVAVGGITSTCPKNDEGEPELLPVLVSLIRRYRPSHIAFIGDNDTALIPAFSHEMVKLARLLHSLGVSLVLPRIPLDAPGKAADDLKEVWGDSFLQQWGELVANPEAVDADTEAADLAVRLLQREQEAFKCLTGSLRDKARKRLVKLGAAFTVDPLVAAGISDFAKAIGMNKTTFKDAVAAQRKSDAEDDSRIEEILGNGDEPPLVFDGQSYWRKESDSIWGKINREDALLSFGIDGLSRSRQDGQVSLAERALHTVQTRHRADYAGPFCGRLPGLYRDNGYRILATRGPVWIEPCEGQCSTILSLLTSLFTCANDPYWETQAGLFFSWLKKAREALKNPERHLPGHVLGLVGPTDCGKSLVQTYIITPSLGGRESNPSQWLTGESSFNFEMWGAEHLVLDDKSLGENAQQRRKLRDGLKEMVASGKYVLHKKYGDALTLRAIWRVSMSVNDDPESIVNLPTIGGGFEDKSIYLRCFAPITPFFDAHEVGAREAFERRLEAELPAFLHIVDNFQIPESLVKGRFGITEWHHPAVLDLLGCTSPLQSLIDTLEGWIATWPPTDNEALLSSVEIYERLNTHLSCDIRSVVANAATLGQQLSLLAEQPAWRGRISREERRLGVNRQKQTVWRIRAAMPVCQSDAVTTV